MLAIVRILYCGIDGTRGYLREEVRLENRRQCIGRLRIELAKLKLPMSDQTTLDREFLLEIVVRECLASAQD